jgi:hypothetical protein
MLLAVLATIDTALRVMAPYETNQIDELVQVAKSAPQEKSVLAGKIKKGAQDDDFAGLESADIGIAVCRETVGVVKTTEAADVQSNESDCQDRPVQTKKTSQVDEFDEPFAPVVNGERSRKRKKTNKGDEFDDLFAGLMQNQKAGKKKKKKQEAADFG